MSEVIEPSGDEKKLNITHCGSHFDGHFIATIITMMIFNTQPTCLLLSILQGYKLS